ncbi:MAG: DUF1559 domain-containing protein [Planctomycetia bacterium]
MIAIIGTLAGLLLPAVQTAREASRRSVCANNMKQIGIALHNHENAKKVFPWGGSMGNDFMNGVNTGNHGFNWRVFILPYVEQNSLWDQLSLLDPTSAGCSSSTWKAIPQHQTIIDTYVCPSETSRRTVAGYTGSYSPGTAAIANYSGSAGPVAVYPYSGSLSCGLCLASQANCLCTNQPGWHYASVDINGGSGMFALRKTYFNSKNVADGTSKTLFVGETKVGATVNGPGPQDTKAVNQWMDPISLASTVHGVNVSTYNIRYFDRSFSSFHPGGAHFVFVDSSVQFIDETIDLFVLSYLGTRAGGESNTNF